MSGKFEGVVCPKCGCKYTQVTDTRKAEGHIRRRRVCMRCRYRFNTAEVYQWALPDVPTKYPKEIKA